MKPTPGPYKRDGIYVVTVESNQMVARGLGTTERRAIANAQHIVDCLEIVGEWEPADFAAFRSFSEESTAPRKKKTPKVPEGM